MNITQDKLLYQGKAKSIYQTDDPNSVIIEYRDDATAFNGEKHATIKNKGAFNNQFNAWIMNKLNQAGVRTHFIEKISETQSKMQKLTMLPIESVMRNRAAGSLSKRYAISENQILTPPLQEFFFKSDQLGDPLITDDHITQFGWASREQLREIRLQTATINQHLSKWFNSAGLLLIDFKLEFGLSTDGILYLGDEITPDGCRIWDKETLTKLDKDRFRLDLGDLLSGYQEIADRLGL